VLIISAPVAVYSSSSVRPLWIVHCGGICHWPVNETVSGTRREANAASAEVSLTSERQPAAAGTTLTRGWSQVRTLPRPPFLPAQI
jgi:hypothetical protein